MKIEQQAIQVEEKRPCEGCGGLTKKNLIITECSRCRGEGSVEDDDPFTGQYFFRKCWDCNGTGTNEMSLWYCGDDCFEMHNYDE